MRSAVEARYTKLHAERQRDPSAFIDRVTILPRPYPRPTFPGERTKRTPDASTRADPQYEHLRKAQEAMGAEWMREGETLAREGRDFVNKMRLALRSNLTDEAQAEFDALLGRYDATFSKFMRDMHTEGRSMTATMLELQQIGAAVHRLFTSEAQQPDPTGFAEFISSTLADSVNTAHCESEVQHTQREEADLEALMTEIEQKLDMRVGNRRSPAEKEEEASRVELEAQRNGVRFTSPDGYVTHTLATGEYRRETVEEAQRAANERAKAMNDRALRKAFMNHVRFAGAEVPRALNTETQVPSIAANGKSPWRQAWQESEETLQQRETRNRRVRARSPRRGRARNTNSREEEVVDDTRSQYNVDTGDWERVPAVGIQERTMRIVEDILGPTLGEKIADQAYSALNEFWGAINQASFGEWTALVISSGILTGIIGHSVMPWAATGNWVQDQRWIGTVNSTSAAIMTRALERHGQQARDISMHTWRAVFEEHQIGFHVADTNALQEQDFLSAITTFSTDGAALSTYMNPNLQRLVNESQQTLQVFFDSVWQNLVKHNRMGLSESEMQSAVGHLHSMAMEMWRKAMDADTPAKMESQLKICSAIVNSMMEGGTEALFKLTNEGVGLSDPRGALEAVGDMINGSVAFNDISLRALMASQTDEEVRNSIKIPFEALRMAAEPGRRASETLPYSAGIAATIVEQYPSTPLVGRVAFILLDIGSGITRLERSYQDLMKLSTLSIAESTLGNYFSVLSSVGWAMFNMFTFFPIIAYAAEGMEQLFGWLENASESAAEFFEQFAEKVAKWGSAVNLIAKLGIASPAWAIAKIAQKIFHATQGFSYMMRHVGHFLKKVLETTRLGTAKARAASVALMSCYFFVQFMLFSAQLGWAFVTFFAPPISGLYTDTLWDTLGRTVAEAVDSYSVTQGSGETMAGLVGATAGWGCYVLVALFRNQLHFIYSWPSYLVKSALSSVRYAISQPERMQSQILWVRMFAMSLGLYMAYRGTGQVETTFSADLNVRAQPNLWFMGDQTLFEDTTDSYRMLNHITNSSGLLSAMRAAESSTIDESLVREWWTRTYNVSSFEEFINHGTVTYDHRITFDELSDTLNTYWRNLTGLETLFETSL